MPREAAKKIWLFTYGASGPGITGLSWVVSTDIAIDECYTLTQRDFNYTLIRTSKRVTVHCMQKVFKDLEDETGIKGTLVFGYDELNYGDSLLEHPGIKMMIEHMNQKSSQFQYWMREGTLETNKRGLLNRFMVSKDLKEMSKIQLLNYIESKKRKAEDESEDAQVGSVSNSKMDNAKVINSIAWDSHPALVEPLFDPGMRAVVLEYNQVDRAIMKAVISLERIVKATHGEIGPYIKSRPGEIYAAFCGLWTALHKLGFSCMGAANRVKQLQTAGLIEPFELVRAAKVPDARLYEKAMHLYFKQVRVYKRKEFFAIERDEVHRFFDQIEGVLERTPKEQQWWDWAFAAASNRLERKFVVP